MAGHGNYRHHVPDPTEPPPTPTRERSRAGLEGRMPESVAEQLSQRGHKVEMRPSWSMNNSGGIMIDYATGTVNAGADPRTQAASLAW